MLDVKWIRETPDELKKALENRRFENASETVEELTRLDSRWRSLKGKMDEFRAKKNKVGQEIADLKKAKKDASAKIEEMRGIDAEADAVEAEEKKAEKELQDLMLTIPNVPDESVAVGESEEENPLVKSWGEPREFSFKPKPHWELGPELGIMDFERGVKIAGHRFTLLKGDGALLERALMNFFLDVHTKEGYKEVFPPLLVNEKTATGTGNLPKFGDQLYYCAEDKLYLLPTAEVPVTNMYADEVLKEEELPQWFCAYTPCFRREAGEYGRDIKGYLRQHQFNKVELVKFSHPKKSFEELDSLTRQAEKVLELLGLPYQTNMLCTGDMGFASAKTYDVNVWLPGQKKYREISSCSNCTDFQARRANIRFKGKDGKMHFVHTLNGSGVAIGRTAIAIIENYQNEDGSITVPEALRPYMRGKEKIEKS